MNVSAKEHCGLQAMAELAGRYVDRPVPLREIARAQGISLHYLEQIVPCLRAAGLVKSRRGAKGGYLLARAPGEITIGEVLRALGRSILSLQCVCKDVAPTCVRDDVFVVRPVWEALHWRMLEMLDGITLADLRLTHATGTDRLSWRRSRR